MRWEGVRRLLSGGAQVVNLSRECSHCCAALRLMNQSVSWCKVVQRKSWDSTVKTIDSVPLWSVIIAPSPSNELPMKTEFLLTWTHKRLIMQSQSAKVCPKCCWLLIRWAGHRLSAELQFYSLFLIKEAGRQAKSTGRDNSVAERERQTFCCVIKFEGTLERGI